MLVIAPIFKLEMDVYLSLTCEAGSGAPIMAIAWPIDRTASSAVRDCAWHLLGARAPFWYFLAEVLRIETRSRYEMSRRSRATYWQNSAHFVQCPLAAADLIVETPSAMSFVTSRKLSQKQT